MPLEGVGGGDVYGQSQFGHLDDVYLALFMFAVQFSQICIQVYPPSP